jgi:hypothetical protein
MCAECGRIVVRVLASTSLYKRPVNADETPGYIGSVASFRFEQKS